MLTSIRNLILITFILTFHHSFAGHPLRTDDARTIGKHSLQLELTPEVWKYASHSYLIIPLTSTYGVTEKADIVLTILYSSFYNSEFQSDLSGINDVALELKWRVLELENFALTLKPGLILPIGNNTIGLGAGKLGYSLLLITDQQLASLLVHFNIGYMRNENKLLERTDLWFTSLAAEIQVANSLLLVAEIGTYSNRDVIAEGHPVFVLGGVVYSIADGIDIDLGLQKGLNKHESDLAVLTGITVLF
ncbi:MAG: transporter [Ignavibacteria bacterium]|nr:transporter [Ignavibacteria bacterium]